MEKFYAEPTKSTPEVSLSPDGRLFMKGESYPEYASKFFGPIYDWLNAFAKTGDEDQVITFDFEISYFNSSSSKAIMNILDILEETAESGKKVVVNWRYAKGNEASQECGEEFKEDICNLDFRLVEI